MSTTLAACRINVRRLMNDLPVGGATAVDDERLTAILNSIIAELGSTLGFSDTWTLSAVVLVSGTREYSLPGTDYQNISIIRRTEDGVILRSRPVLEIESMYQSTAAIPGDPTDYAIYESSTPGTAKIRLYPTPNLANAQHLDTFGTTASAVLTLPSDVVPFTRLGVQAVELLAAADCVAGMSTSLMEERHINGNLAVVMKDRGDRLVSLEASRQNALVRQDYVTRVRY